MASFRENLSSSGFRRDTDEKTADKLGKQLFNLLLGLKAFSEVNKRRALKHDVGLLDLFLLTKNVELIFSISYN